ncbi:hypothetical protein NEMIN01_1160 [Nematocida minor]|uniref:uncharacterized protein n=1 Tax=Nematocida minor TaxID=1912983 RepID=UPI00221F5F25|nr:uncharacterized protein NEMIN01_1160 [Nematocida minor]KAI5190695.1 hypothetical protein NEMIN01_1160 [Nematocida minor]
MKTLLRESLNEATKLRSKYIKVFNTAQTPEKILLGAAFCSMMILSMFAIAFLCKKLFSRKRDPKKYKHHVHHVDENEVERIFKMIKDLIVNRPESIKRVENSEGHLVDFSRSYGSDGTNSRILFKNSNM